MKELYNKGYNFSFDITVLIPFLTKEEILSVKEYCQLDDVVVNYYIKQAINEKDDILSDLARRIISRDLLEYRVLKNEKEIEIMKEQASEYGYNPDYYVAALRLRRNIYKKYGKVNYAGINILLDNGEVKEITKVSQIVEAISNSKIQDNEDTILYYPNFKR